MSSRCCALSSRAENMAPHLELRNVTDEDLPILFEFQRDPEANRMAAFTARDPEDRAAFAAHLGRILMDPTVTMKTIVADGVVVGSVGRYVRDGHPEITYWVGREHWGKGLATLALKELLKIETERPIFAGAAKDNVGSLRVLEKCGFRVTGSDRGFANARGEEVEEVLLRLD